ATKLQAKNTLSFTETLSCVEELLGKADSPQESLEWAKVREEILRQDESVREQNHQRVLEKIRLIYGIVFSATVFLTGIVLFICRYDNAVYLIAVGLLPLLSRRKKTENNHE
ncbi:MAG: hypothetical protein F6K09_26750, partial [Merismopedia sp. SIO2A8]|nr:hypothetical protein [Merismopedia sp. SIO2A8]